MSLATPDKIRTLQRKLYEKAKRESRTSGSTCSTTRSGERTSSAMPTTWRATGNLGLGDDVSALLNEFFKGTERVVLVALYSKLTTDLPQGTAISYACRQFENRSSRFVRNGSWGLSEGARQNHGWVHLSSALRP
jgi:hypothetical protein